MEEQHIGGSPARDSEPGNEVASASRRRLLRGGLGAAPVIASFVSQPVHAAYSCKSASAFTSANASRPGAAQCNGASAAWWLANPLSWVGCNYLTSLFSTYFSVTSTYPSGTTLRQVLQGTSTGYTDKMARNLVAALLNVKAGRIGAGVFTEAQLQLIWTSALGAGYVPTAGAAPWYPQQVNAWLASVFPAEV